MNYEQTRELLKENMVQRNYALDTQKKFAISLNAICKYSGKYHDTSLLSHTDVKNFLENLQVSNEIGNSTINNYRAAFKFIFEVTLKKGWNDSIFPYLTVKRNYKQDLDLPGIYSHKDISDIVALNEALHRMIVEMELRGFATGTQSSYLRAIKGFTAFVNESDNLLNLTLNDVRSFLYHNQVILNQNPQTVNTKRTAIKFLFVNILNLDWDDNKVPYLKLHKTVPVVLSKKEVLCLINAIENTTYRTIAILMYSAGLRVSEAIKLRISDIDSKNMQILVTHGKRNKDRYVILSEKCLHALREYYKIYKPTNYLFEGQRFNPYISKESVQGAIRVAAIKCGITKKVSPHTLRHCFASHLLENNTNLYYIKQLLGHSCVRSSSRYLETVSFRNFDVKSPLDTLGGNI